MSDPLGHFSFLWKYASQWKWRIVLALAALCVVAVTTLVYPWLLKLIVDGFDSTSADTEGLLWFGLGLLLVFTVSTFSGYYQQITMHELGYRLRNLVREDLYRNLLSRPLSFHRKQQVGELSSRATDDLARVQPVFTSLVAPVFQNLIVVTGGLLLSLVLNWMAAIVLVFFLVVPAPFVLRYSRRIRVFSSEAQAEHAKANAYLEETLVAIREVKAFARENLELERYRKLIGNAFDREISASRLVIRGNQSAYFFLSAMLLTMFYIAASASLPGWTMGSMVAFYFYSYTIAMALLSIGRIYLTYQSVSGALSRVEALLGETRPAGSEEGSGEYAGRLNGSVELRNVTFGYETGKPVLINTSLIVHEGEWVVIGGPSGSGKSTLANLLLGFYQPGSGEVNLGGTPLNAWKLSMLRRQIGFVGQDPVLFYGTVRDNLLVSDDRLSEADLSGVLETVCLREMIENLPNGLDTVVGERGYTLSGGQKSRVAMARALLLRPAVLILDEANAMLEPDLERRLWQNLIDTGRNRTTIILTHHKEHIPEIFRSFTMRSGILTEG